MATVPSVLSSNEVVSLSLTTGQQVIAIFIATGFWGMACIQTLFFFLTYDSDEWYFKALVVVLWILDTLHEILSMKSLWIYMIPKYGDLANLTVAQPEAYLAEVATGLVAAIAQSFYTWRIWRFSGEKMILPMIMGPPILWQLVGRISYTVRGIGQPPSIDTTPIMTKLALGITFSSAGFDVILAFIMCMLLWSGRTGLQSSDRIIFRLINASVGTGVCTAAFEILTGVALLASPKKFIFALGSTPIPALYCNAVLANLNSRKYIGRQDEASHVIGTQTVAMMIGTLRTSDSRTDDGQRENEENSRL